MSLIFFFGSVVFFSVLLGIAIGHFHWWPYYTLRDAYRTVTVPAVTLGSHLAPVRYERSGVRMPDAEAVAPGVTLLTGLWPEYDWQAGIRLINADGDVLHRWQTDPMTIWSADAVTDPYRKQRHSPWNFIHGCVLLVDGSVVFNIEEMGMARLDAAGKVMWATEIQTHHSLTVADDGSFWACGLRWIPRDAPRMQGFPGLEGPIMEELAVNIDRDGRVLRELSLLKVAYDDMALRRAMWRTNARELTEDLLHLNDVEPLPAALAEEYPLFEAGDLMVSFRDIHTVAVLDPETGTVKWSDMSTCIRQHDPDFIGDGWIRIFDNNTDWTRTGEYLGGSRIVDVRPHTGETRVAYPTGGAPPFYTPRAGKCQTLPNGNMLITETLGGRVFEVTASGELAWEWIQPPHDTFTSMVTEIHEGSRYAISEETIESWTGK